MLIKMGNQKDDKPDNRDDPFERDKKKNQKTLMRKRKGWKGFVHGYKAWLEACDEGRWDAVNWGKDGDKSGAKEIVRDGNKTVYKY